MQRRHILLGLGAAISASAWLSFKGVAMQSDPSNLPEGHPERVADLLQKMRAAFPFEYVTVKGAETGTAWAKLRQSTDTVPVVIGNDESLDALAEQYSLDDIDLFANGDAAAKARMAAITPPIRTLSEILTSSESISFPEGLRRWEGAYTEEDLTAPVGKWPADVGQNLLTPEFIAAYDLLSGRVFDQVHILKVPASNSWEVPAHLRWGGWNACPPPEYHVAALKEWNERFGAELVGINRDTIELWVESPPSDRATALQVAKDIYRYCPDSVDQGTDTIAALAGTMVMQKSWTFWWD